MVTNVIGQQFIELASVDSTNKYAAEHLALRKLRHGAVIMAHEQVAGRGQRGRVWRSGKGLDLTASVVLLPQRLLVGEQFILGKLAALAVHDVVADIFRAAGKDADRVRIKWPNDILVDRRKIAGILIKNEVAGMLVQTTIMGFGLNVNSAEHDPEMLATSLRVETGEEHDVRAVLGRLCQRIEHYWDILEQDVATIERAYSSLLWARGRFAEFELDGTPFTARPVDADAGGRLIVEDMEGQIHAFGTERLRFGPR